MNSRAQDGFTLIEILVALGILAVSLSVLLSVMSISLAHTRQTQDETAAALYLQSLMARAGTEFRLTNSDTTGVFANGMRWRLQIQPYANISDRQTSPVVAMSIKAAASWRDGNTTRNLTLSTLRLVPKQAP